MFPQYVWMFCYLESTKILLKLNFETGFYKLKKIKKDLIQKEIDKIPSDECSICLDPLADVKAGYNDGDNIIKLKCNHYFHTKCLCDWIETKCAKDDIQAPCPECRGNIFYSNCIDFGIKDNETVKDLAGSVHVFSTCIYADLILGVDNVDNRISKKQFYWFLGTVLFRLGTQAVWYGDNGWELKPFIGIGGMTLSFLCINISIIPMIYLTGRVGENNPRFVVDICTEFTFYRKFFYK